MKRLLYELSRTLAFRKIQHEDLPLLVNRLPLLLALIVCAVFFVLPVAPKVFGEAGLTRSLIPLLSVLPGFFIAALAAVSTFDRPTLDETMPEPAPTLKMRTADVEAPVELTMRLFISYMFAYLTALSFSTVLFAIFAELLAPSVFYWVKLIEWQSVSGQILQAIGVVYVFFFSWLVASIAVVTLYGMYFLVERMHRPRA